MPHHSDAIMGVMAHQITSLSIVHSTVYSGADQRKHQSSASLGCLRGIHLWPVNSPHTGSVTRKIFPFDDVIMLNKHCIIRLCVSHKIISLMPYVASGNVMQVIKWHKTFLIYLSALSEFNFAMNGIFTNQFTINAQYINRINVF